MTGTQVLDWTRLIGVLLCAAELTGAAERLLLELDGSPDGRTPSGIVAGRTGDGVAWVDGQHGKAIYVPEGGSCVVPTGAELLGNAGQIEVWVRPDWPSTDGERHAILVDSRRVLKLYKHTSGLVYLQIRLSRPAGALSIGTRVQWKPTEWYHVVAAWSGLTAPETPAVAALYIDGVCEGWQSVEQAVAHASGPDWWVGSDTDGQYPFSGALDAVRVLDTPTVSLEEPATKPAVNGVPRDEPYLPTTDVLPKGVTPDPIHRLDLVRHVGWPDWPVALAEDVFGTTPAQRVIYRDTVTGCEVWLLRRSSAHEGVAYTNYHPYNANGSHIRVWGLGGRIRSDGSQFQSFRELIPDEFSGLPRWHSTDPDTVICDTPNGGTFEYNLRRKTRTDVYIPDDTVPEGTWIQFSDDRSRSLFISRQGRKRPFWISIGDRHGQNREELTVHSVSPEPDSDRMGSSQFLRDQHGRLYARYSLNKGHGGDGPTPYQNWLVPLDGGEVRRMDSHNNLLDGTPLHFVPAGTYVVTGHGGYSPSMRYFIHHRGRPGVKWIRDTRTWEQRDIARIPGCDHMDWTVDENWFFVWANQLGAPIYQVFVDTGVVHRVVATNSCAHNYGSCPYHGASPDGTKLLYKSSMLDSLDLYMAVVTYPEPPHSVTVRLDGDVAVLEWEPPARGRETAGYNVYRGTDSGTGYRLLSTTRVSGTTYRDPDAPPKSRYVVTSVEHCGLEGRRFSNEAALSTDGPYRRYWQAEDGALTYPARRLFLPGQCSANYAIGRAQRAPMWELARGDGDVSWRVVVPRTGPCLLWARSRCISPDSGEVGVSVDGAPEAPVEVSGEDWGWLRLWTEPVRLEKGEHVIRARLPRFGPELDQLLLTDDLDAAPTGSGSAPLSQLRPPEGLTASVHGDGQTVVLRWDASGTPGVHHYQVYRTTAPDTRLAQHCLLGSPSATGFLDQVGAGPCFYRVTAVDGWGNETAPGTPVSVPGTQRDAAASVRLFFEAETASLKDGQKVATGEQAEGRGYLAFGAPDQLGEYLGEASIPANVAPGEYYLWFRVKGGPLKSAAFFWVRFGETEHYSRMRFPDWERDKQWVWRRVTFLNSVSDPREKPVCYKVVSEPVSVTIRQRANYLAIDRVMVTSSSGDVPEADAEAWHPRCSKRFHRVAGSPATGLRPTEP